MTHPDKNKQIKEWPIPQNAKDVRSFLGLAGFYQRFVKNFADHATPLTDLLKKDVPFAWTPAAAAAFEAIRDELSEVCRLSYPDLNKEFVVHLDASATALGATLSQLNTNGELQLVTCTSRKLNPAEKNYPTHEMEMLALVHALKKWKHYLLGSKVVAYTDNVALKFWRTAQNLSPRQIRWLSLLQMYDLEIAHIPGSINIAADALSRLQEVNWKIDYWLTP